MRANKVDKSKEEVIQNHRKPCVIPDAVFCIETLQRCLEKKQVKSFYFTCLIYPGGSSWHLLPSWSQMQTSIREMKFGILKA